MRKPTAKKVQTKAAIRKPRVGETTKALNHRIRIASALVDLIAVMREVKADGFESQFSVWLDPRTGQITHGPIHIFKVLVS